MRNTGNGRRVCLFRVLFCPPRFSFCDHLDDVFIFAACFHFCNEADSWIYSRVLRLVCICLCPLSPSRYFLSVFFLLALPVDHQMGVYNLSYMSEQLGLASCPSYSFILYVSYFVLHFYFLSRTSYYPLPPPRFPLCPPSLVPNCPIKTQNPGFPRIARHNRPTDRRTCRNAPRRANTLEDESGAFPCVIVS